MAEYEELTGDYLGMPVSIEAADAPNQEFFRRCARQEFALQKCGSCGLLRYPPSTGCPHCGAPHSTWEPVEPTGAIYTYAEVPHAIQPVFRDHLPYMIAIVELDVQRGQPQSGDGLRVAGNLVHPDGTLADPKLIERTGIGSRMHMVFRDFGDDFAMPMWTPADPEDDVDPWRYPED